MKTNKLLIGLTCLLAVSVNAQINLTGSYRICNWKGNKKAAASITFDDNCPGQFDFAIPLLRSRNFKSTFFIITAGSQCGLVDWLRVDSAHQEGHEIGSHSLTHLNMTNSDSLTIETELGQAYQTLRERYYPENWKMTIAYPFGRGGGSSAQDKRIRRIGSKYYYAGRSAGVGPSGFTGYNDYTNPFYTDFYLQIGTYVMGPGNLPTGPQLSNILDNTKTAGGWFTGLYHGIETNGFNSVPALVFAEHLDSMKARETDLWIAPFGKVAQYHAEKRGDPKLALLSFQPDPALPGSFWYTYQLQDTLTGPWFQEPLTIRLGRLLSLPEAQIDSNAVWTSGGPFNFSVSGNPATDTVQFDLAPGDTVRMHIRLFTSIKDLREGSVASLFPNPGNGPLKLVLPAGMEFQDPKIQDLSGRIVAGVDARKISDSVWEIDPKGLTASGQYFLVFGNGKGKIKIPFVRK
jgi:peptidoglycan/xylan/chitin deacetylase (PgdA/CDA1 family)